jgi:hypothetical protein
MGNLTEYRKGWGQQHITILKTRACLGYICGKMAGIKDGGVHLPVSGKQWSSLHN